MSELAEQEIAPNAERPALVSRWGWIAYGVAALVVLLDQLSKYWVLQVIDLAHRGPIRVLPFFQLNMLFNEGVSFGFFKASSPLGKWALVLFALAVVVGLVIWARRVVRPATAVALGLIIGGAIGNNLIDRVRFGAVADFLDFHWLMFPWVFNVGDSAITVGVAILVLDSFLRPQTPADAAT